MMLNSLSSYSSSFAFGRGSRMDFNSDGTREVLQRYIDHPNLDIIYQREHGVPHLQMVETKAC